MGILEIEPFCMPESVNVSFCPNNWGSMAITGMPPFREYSKVRPELSLLVLGYGLGYGES
ncbi:MAG: hypothetical protein OQJ89_13470 [Kangiellaceae bacterium]|nr:hypothetical protein [Kangiellaceae bacterium]MCW8997952.1 hypothetical protein [Kangiellaceae bacterium]MCW9017974.1 hypothetical protein [Kangiellaceae bacterium]